jgi:LEA14-like dessication related protein
MNSKRGETLSILFLILVMVLLLGFVFLDQASSSEKQSALSLSQFQIAGLQSINSSGTTIIVQFTIQNSTPLSGTIEKAVFNLYADGGYIGRGAIDQPVKVPAKSTVSTTTDLLLPLAGGLRGTWSYFLDVGTVSWRATGNATIFESITGVVKIQFDCTSVKGSGSISCTYSSP